MTYKAKRIIPAFATEAEEAAWWYEHREETAQDFVDAGQAGQLGEGTRDRLARMREEAAKKLAEDHAVTAGR